MRALDWAFALPGNLPPSVTATVRVGLVILELGLLSIYLFVLFVYFAAYSRKDRSAYKTVENSHRTYVKHAVERG